MVRAVRKVLVSSRKLVSGAQMWVAAQHRCMSGALSRVYKRTRVIMGEKDTFRELLCRGTDRRDE